MVYAAHAADKPTPPKVERLELKLGDERPRVVAFSPDGKTLAVGTSKNKVLLWDVAGSRELSRPAPKESEDGGEIRSLVFSPDGKKLAGVFRVARDGLRIS